MKKESKESVVSSKSYSIDISSLEALQSWVKDWKENIKFKDVLLLNGEMGSGKTQFVKFLVNELNETLAADVCSPTYSIHNCYVLNDGDGNEKKFDHVDLYRLEDETDLESTGFWDLLSQESGVLAIEWAERMGSGVLEEWGILHSWNVWTLHFSKDGACRTVTFKQI